MDESCIKVTYGFVNTTYGKVTDVSLDEVTIVEKLDNRTGEEIIPLNFIDKVSIVKEQCLYDGTKPTTRHPSWEEKIKRQML